MTALEKIKQNWELSLRRCNIFLCFQFSVFTCRLFNFLSVRLLRLRIRSLLMFLIFYRASISLCVRVSIERIIKKSPTDGKWTLNHLHTDWTKKTKKHRNNPVLISFPHEHLALNGALCNYDWSLHPHMHRQTHKIYLNWRRLTNASGRSNICCSQGFWININRLWMRESKWELDEEESGSRSFNFNWCHPFNLCRSREIFR